MKGIFLVEEVGNPVQFATQNGKILTKREVRLNLKEVVFTQYGLTLANNEFLAEAISETAENVNFSKGDCIAAEIRPTITSYDNKQYQRIRLVNAVCLSTGC